MKRFLSVLTLAVYSSQLLVSCGWSAGGPTDNAQPVAVERSQARALTGDEELTPPSDPLVRSELDGDGLVPGSTKGHFGVTPDGAATYQVPLWVPAGRAGIQPSLSLDYNSRSGNGMLGMGFSLSGLSQIVRCNKTLIQDGAPAPVKFDSSDAFCLDGARLVQTGSLGGGDKTFTTEVERFSYIIARQADALGPSWFEVQLKSGIVLEYGREGASRIEGYRMHYMPGSNSPANASVIGDHTSEVVRYGWSLSRVRDRNGNYMVLDYELRVHGDASSGYGYEQLPVAMRYTGSTTDSSVATPQRSIQFSYQGLERFDPIEQYVSGFKLVNVSLLESISMRAQPDAGVNPLRKYRFLYSNDSITGRSKLWLLHEDDASQNTKRPLIFTWELGARGTGRDELPSNGDQYFLRVPVAYAAPSVMENAGVPDKDGYPSAADFWTLQTLDINGDGRDDIMYRFSPSASGKIQNPKWYFRLNLDGRSFGPPTLLSALPEAKTGDGMDDLRTVDLNNDGKTDIIGLYLADADTNTNGRYQFFNSTGNGFTETQGDTFDFWFDQTQPARLPTMHVADLNGDGLPDVARSISGSYPYEWGVRLTQVDAAGTPTLPAAHQRTGVPAGLDHAGYVVDVDGDGASEVLVREPETGTSDGFSRFLVALGRTDSGTIGKKLTTTLSTLPVPNSYNPYIYRHHWFMDINGDGLPDSVSVKSQKMGQESGSLEISINTGNGFSPPVTQSLPDGAQVSFSRLSTQDRFTDVGVRVIDFNMDGKQDLLLTDGGYGVGTRTTHVVLQSTGSGFEVRTLNIPVGITTGQGNFTSLSADGQHTSYKGSGWGMKTTQLLDANGDGLTDIMQVEPVLENGQYRYTPVLYLRNAYKPDLLKSVQDGLGKIYSVTYESTTYNSPLITATHHTPGSCTYPQSCDMRAQWLVTSFTEPDGKYSTRTLRYNYAEGRMDLRGRGWQGFASRTVTDVKAASQLTTTYDNQTRTGRFYLGSHLPSNEVLAVMMDGGQVDTFKTSSEYAYQSKLDGAVVFPYLWRTTTQSVDGQYGELRRNVTTDTYDGYGNLTNRQVQSKDGHIIVTATTYDNFPDSGDFLLGLPRRVSVTSQTPAGASQTRTHEYQYCVGASCRPTSPLPLKEIMEPDATDPERADLWLETTYTRNASGLPTWMVSTDSAGHTRRMELKYDSYERMLPVTQIAYPTDDPDGPILRTDYAYHRGLGLLTLQQAPNGQQTRWYHDDFGRIRAVDGPDANDIIVSYGSEATFTAVSTTVSTAEVDASTCGYINWVKDFTTCTHNGQESTLTYDVLGREEMRRTRGFDGSWVQMKTQYDQLGRISSVSMPATIVEPEFIRQFEYDQRGRLRFVRNPDGTFLERQYQGLKTIHWDEKRNQAYQLENEQGLPVQSVNVTSAGPVSTQYEYGPFGLPTLITDASNNSFVMEYDRLGRRTLLNDPDSGVTHTSYFAFGNPRARTDGNGNTLLYTYDGIGRPVTVTDQSAVEGSTPAVTSLTWDTALHGLGLLHTATSADGVVQTYAYDDLSRPTEERWNIQGQEYLLNNTYDSRGRLDTLAYPEVAGRSRLGVRYNYTDQGQLKSVQNVLSGLSYWTATARNSSGMLTGESFGNGVSSVRRYDNLGQLRFIETTGPGGGVQALAYDYDANGNLHSQIDRLAQVTEDFQYDDVDRLKQWTVYKGCNNAVFTYDYDKLGNPTYRTSKLGTAANAPSEAITYGYGAGAGPHAMTSAGPDSFEYDGNGNLKRHQDGTGSNRLLDYTSFNLPRHIAEGTSQWSFGYDANHGRAFKQGNDGSNTVYVGGAYEKRTWPDGTTSHLFVVHGTEGVVAQVEWSDTPVPGGEAVAYLHKDRLGSIETVTGNGGTVLEHRKYDPFGLRKSAVNPALAYAGGASSVRQGFTSHEQDEELGLVNMNGRMYDPKFGRFLSPDPLVQAPLFGQSLNRYSYALNNPLSFTDPSGFENDEVGPQEGAKGPVSYLEFTDGDTFEHPSPGLLTPPTATPPTPVPTARTEVPWEAAKGPGVDPFVGTADQNGSRASGLQAAAYGAAGLAFGAGMGLATAYALGAVSVLLGAPVAAAAGVGLAAYGLYQLATGGGKALWASGERIFQGRGTTQDYFSAGAFVGGIASMRISRPAFELGGRHAAWATNSGSNMVRALTLCFAPGTQILMADGSSKSIEDVREGDLVLADDPLDDEGPSPFPVTQQLENYTHSIVRVSVQKEAGGRGGVIEATRLHPFWIRGSGWKAAVDLQPGDVLMDADGEAVTVANVSIESRQTRTFNLSIDARHTFFVVAGGASVLVHNIDPWDIYFSREPDGPMETFQHGPWKGRTVAEAIEATRELGYLPEGLTLGAGKINDQPTAINNRTLYVAQEAGLVDVSPEGLNTSRADDEVVRQLRFAVKKGGTGYPIAPEDIKIRQHPCD